MFDIALVTYKDLPDLDADDALLIPALAERGLNARPVVWDDPSIDWSQFNVAVIRSTWDYHHQRATFLDWAERVAGCCALWNPLELLSWNTHKFYLRDLEERGILVVPTIWLEQGTRADLAMLMKQRDWQKVVIKPAVSASAYGTILVTREDIERGQAHLNRFLVDHDMLLQPFLSTVTTSRERSLIFIDGQPTHAIERMPALDLELVGRDRLLAPPEEEWQFARQILRVLPVTPLYARVDLIHDEAGGLRLMELELVEPGLWLSLAPATVQAFADAIASKMQR